MKNLLKGKTKEEKKKYRDFGLANIYYYASDSKLRDAVRKQRELEKEEFQKFIDAEVKYFL